MQLIWIIKANYIPDFKLGLEFNNGASGVLDLKDKLDLPIFEPLKNKTF